MWVGEFIEICIKTFHPPLKVLSIKNVWCCMGGGYTSYSSLDQNNNIGPFWAVWQLPIFTNSLICLQYPFKGGAGGNEICHTNFTSTLFLCAVNMLIWLSSSKTCHLNVRIVVIHWIWQIFQILFSEWFKFFGKSKCKMEVQFIGRESSKIWRHETKRLLLLLQHSKDNGIRKQDLKNLTNLMSQ